MASRLTRDFYTRPTLDVARDLLGQRLVRLDDSGRRVGGRIVEAEAYVGPQDLGCHAKAGRTRRNAVMWSTPGAAYVYFTYGMHWMLNLVTERDGFPAAVLLRAILPQEGVDLIEQRRGHQPRRVWTDGPAKLCQALAIDGQWNGHDTCAPRARLFVEEGEGVDDSLVVTGPRIGLNTVPEPWKSMPWRFLVNGRPR